MKENDRASMDKLISEARQNFQPFEDYKNGQTNFLRGEEDIKMLSEIVIPRLLTKGRTSITVGIIGLGIEAYPVFCTYQPYKIAAFLETTELNPHIVMVDNDKDITAKMFTRKYLYISEKSLKDKEIKKAWDRYLFMTRLTDNKIDTQPVDLEFHEVITSGMIRASGQDWINKGIRSVNIPSSFKNKINNGDYRIILDDISRVSLPTEMDYISCINLLYLLPKEGQILAIENMAKALRQGGVLLINDVGAKGGLISKWLTPDLLVYFGLKADEAPITENVYVLYAYHKI
jgi:chemotaxis methyl-accepting protein methylase